MSVAEGIFLKAYGTGHYRGQERLHQSACRDLRNPQLRHRQPPGRHRGLVGSHRDQRRVVLSKDGAAVSGPGFMTRVVAGDERLHPVVPEIDGPRELAARLLDGHTFII